MPKYTRHVVVEMDETMVQHCVICGEIINDYRNTMWPKDQDPPKGFSDGSVYIFKEGFRTRLTTLISKNDTFIDCKAKK